jgi:hypothetical protein
MCMSLSVEAKFGGFKRLRPLCFLLRGPQSPVLHGSAHLAADGSLLRANRSRDLEHYDRASIRLENAAGIHHPPQPHQAYVIVAAADAVEAEVESGTGVDVGAGLEVGAEIETWAQAEPGPHDEVEPGSRMRKGNTSAARLNSAQAAPDPSSQAI